MEIQWLKRFASGFRDRDRFRAAIDFHLGGLDLYPDLYILLRISHSLMRRRAPLTRSGPSFCQSFRPAACR